MILTICGPPGSGKDTVAQILAKKLGYNLVSMGNIKRQAAAKKDMTIEQFNAWTVENPKEGDLFFDDFQKEYGEKNDDFIMVARLGWYFIPHSKKIYVNVSDDAGAERIFKQKQTDSRHELAVSSVEEQEKLNLERKNHETTHFLKLYSIDPHDVSNYEIVVDSSNVTPEEVAKEILEQL
jgi:CMP/dCMP kinase